MTLLDHADTPDLHAVTEVSLRTFLPEGADPDSALMTIEEVAAYLRVPVGTVRKWRQKNTGPRARLIGRSLRFTFGDVRSWFEQHPTT